MEGRIDDHEAHALREEQPSLLGEGVAEHQVGPARTGREEYLLLQQSRLVERMRGSVADWQPPELPDLSRFDEVVLDLETTGLAWWRGDRLIGAGLRTPDGVCRYLPVRHRVGPNIPERKFFEWCRRELLSKRLVNLRTKFDLHMFRMDGIDLEAQGCTFGDVSHYAALLDDHRRLFNQEDLARAYLGEEYVGKVTASHGFALDPGRFAEYPAGLVAARAEGDVETVFRLQAAMWPQLTEQNLHHVRQIEDALIPAVVEMEHNGAPIDVELLNDYCTRSERDVESCLWEIQRATGVRLETPNQRAGVKRLFETLRIPMPLDPETEKPTLADDALEAIDHPVILTLRRAIALASLRSKFLLKYQRSVAGSGILRYELHQLPYQDDAEGRGGAVSGRFSSAAMTYYDARGKQVSDGGNIQQVFGVKSQDDPKRVFNPTRDYIVKKLFKPAAGVWFGSDMRQVEYRRFVHYSESEKLIESYRKDPLLDYHKLMHGLILQHTGRDYERTHVKNLNFACVERRTPVLTADLRWMAAGDLCVGDELLAFDDDPRGTGRGRGRARRWRRSLVTHNEVVSRECVEVTLVNGESVITTPEHPWLTYDWHGRGVWRTSQELRPFRDLVVQAADVWQEKMTKDAGWLSGFYDGEGCAARDTVSVNQNPGILLDKCARLLKQFGYDCHAHPRNGSPVKGGNRTIGFNLQGNVSDRLRFLGEIRPIRLIDRFVQDLIGTMFQARERVGVLNVRAVGRREIAALSTSSATYVAGGYAMHNSIYGAGLIKIALMVGEVNEKVYLELSGKQQRAIEDRNWDELKRIKADPRISKTKSLYDTYHGMFPEVKELLDQASKTAEKRGYVMTLVGSRARFSPGDRMYSAFNRVIQGTAAYDNKVALIDVHSERHRLGFTPRMTVHDSLGGDLADPAMLPEMARFLNEPRLESRVPLLWDSGIGPTWADAK